MATLNQQDINTGILDILDLTGIKKSKKEINNSIENNNDTNDVIGIPVKKRKKTFFTDLDVQQIQEKNLQLNNQITSEINIAPQIKQIIAVNEIDLPLDDNSTNIQKTKKSPIQSILIPESIGQTLQVNKLETIGKKKRKEKVKAIITQNIAINSVVDNDNVNFNDEKIQEVKEAYQELTNKELPENIDVIELVNSVNTAVDEIPDGDNYDLTNIDIIPVLKEKGKNGYYKVKCAIQKSNIPPIINDIASFVKQTTKGVVKPRVCDLRVIANANKTQLKNNRYKLSAATVLFKPDNTKLKVAKYNRFLISIPEDYNNTGNLLVFMQDSRAKNILEISRNDFETEKSFILFLGNRIADFYTLGYDTTLAKLTLKQENKDPLLEILTKILKSGNYKGKPFIDKETGLASFIDIISKSDKNQWLTIRISEASIIGKYDISGFNSVTGDEYNLLGSSITSKWLLDNSLNIIEKAYDKDWDLKVSDDVEKLMYFTSKLKHNKLRNACIEISNTIDDEEIPENFLSIINTASRRDMEKLLNNDYDAESIIGKGTESSQISEFVLTFLAYPIEGGDSRHGKDFITTEIYYEKYSVNDKNDYINRKRSLGSKGIDRNYNSRIYLFQLEYKTKKGKSHIYRAKTFQEIKDNTGFFYNDIKFPKTEY
jgi:hypothetical protein